MKTFDFRGIITALVTPFRSGEVDYQSFQKLLDYQLNQGVEGFVVNGTTGESPTLSREEVKKLLDIAKVEVGGQVPILLGTGSNCTRTTVQFTELACEWGADAALVVTPYYNKPPQRGLVAHFRAVGDASRIPIFLYNVPSRTITALSLETIERLSEHPRIVGVKEASGDISFGQKILSQCGGTFMLTSGDDATCVELASVGAEAVISVASHIIGSEMKEHFHQARKKNLTAVKNYATRFKDLNQILYVEANPIPLKTALFLMGIIATPDMRLPLQSLPEEHIPKLKSVLSALGKL